MDILSFIIILLSRALLILIFLPFSSFDKVANFGPALAQAGSVFHVRVVAVLAILAGLFIEISMSLAVLTGIADRMAALVLALYCVVTALLWKQFWKINGFSLLGPGSNRDLFWDFLKNLALAGGFLMLAFGGGASGLRTFLEHPLASSHPYAITGDGRL